MNWKCWFIHDWQFGRGLSYRQCARCKKTQIYYFRNWLTVTPDWERHFDRQTRNL
jgi:hypothetical protein